MKKIKRLTVAVLATVMLVSTFAISASAATNYDWNLSSSYEKYYGDATLGYDVGSIAPWDDVWGWTYNHAGYWNSNTGRINTGNSYIKVTALNGDTSSYKETYISPDGYIYATCSQIGSQDFAQYVDHSGTSDATSSFNYHIY